MAKINLKYTTVLLHVFIWSLLFTLPHFFFDNRNTPPGFLPGSFFIVTNFYHIGLFYLNGLVLYPLFFNKRRWWLFICIIAAIILVSYYIKLFVIKQWYSEVSFNEWTYRILFFPPLPFLIVSTVYGFVVDKVNRDKKQKEIQAEQVLMKLKFLRSQISPHFIFNVLTNLVALARKKSEQLEPQLIKLSELMRYMLYESDEKKVSLLKEVEYLKSYIELQNLRFGHDVATEVVIHLAEKELERTIEPMLLIPFVENAFKHGIGVDNPFIQIHLEGNASGIDFDVRNKFDKNEAQNKDTSPGIGLENVRSRLALLYAKRHKLIVAREKEIFHIHLTLHLI